MGGLRTVAIPPSFSTRRIRRASLARVRLKWLGETATGLAEEADFSVGQA